MPRLGVIGGSGLDAWTKGADQPVRQITVDTAWGEASAPLRAWRLGDVEFLFLPRHGDQHQWAPHRVNYRANIDALRRAGVQRVLAINAVGGMGHLAKPGLLVVPDQLIDYTWGRAHTFFDRDDTPLVHTEFDEPFCAQARRSVLKAGEAAGLVLREGGCLGVTQGPRLETAAEIRRLVRDGCDLVGMTSLPEASLAREGGLSYAALCVVANAAAGESPNAVSVEQIEATLAAAMADVKVLVEHWVQAHEA